MFGWIQNRFWNSIKWSPARTQIAYVLPFDSRRYLDKLSRTETVRMVEGLAQEFPLLKEGFRGIARHVIGKGLELQLNTGESDFDAEAELQFEEYAITADRFDIAGRRNLFEAQPTAIEQRLFRGEFFAAAVTNPRWGGEPAWQLFDTNEICTPEGRAEEGNIIDGIRVDQHHAPVEYFVKDVNGERAIPAAAMRHWYQPTGINQVRGESDFACVINRIVNWNDLETLFTQHAKTHSTLAVAVSKLAKVGGRGVAGVVSRANPDGTAATDTQALEKAFPGMVAYLGSDGEAKLLSSNSPNEQLAKFITDVLAPQVFAALGIPPEFFWNVTAPGGTSQRFILSRADLLFQILADGLTYRWLNAVAFRFLQHRIATGRLKAPKNPNWSATMRWTSPVKLSVDRGDRQLEIEELHNGKTNLRRCFDNQNLRWKDETRQWIREFRVFKELCGEEGLTPEETEQLLMRWRPPKPGVVIGTEASGAAAATPDPAA